MRLLAAIALRSPDDARLEQQHRPCQREILSSDDGQWHRLVCRTHDVRGPVVDVKQHAAVMRCPFLVAMALLAVDQARWDKTAAAIGLAVSAGVTVRR